MPPERPAQASEPLQTCWTQLPEQQALPVRPEQPVHQRKVPTELPERPERPGRQELPVRQQKVPTELPVRPELPVHQGLQVRRQPSALPEYLQTSVR